MKDIILHTGEYYTFKGNWDKDKYVGILYDIEENKKVNDNLLIFITDSGKRLSVWTNEIVDIKLCGVDKKLRSCMEEICYLQKKIEEIACLSKKIEEDNKTNIKQIEQAIEKTKEIFGKN